MPREFFVKSFVEPLFKIRERTIVPEFGLVTNFVSPTRFSMFGASERADYLESKTTKRRTLISVRDAISSTFRQPAKGRRNYSTRTFHVSRGENGASVSTRRPHSTAERFILLDWKVSNIGGRGPSTYIPIRELEEILRLSPPISTLAIPSFPPPSSFYPVWFQRVGKIPKWEDPARIVAWVTDFWQILSDLVSSDGPERPDRAASSWRCAPPLFPPSISKGDNWSCSTPVILHTNYCFYI